MLQNKESINNYFQIEPCNENCSFCFLNYTDILASNYLFRNLSKEKIAQVIKDIHHRVKTLSNAEVLATEGEKLHDIMIIVKGSVIGEMMDFEGNILRVEEIRAPETIATAFIFGKKGILPVTITATEETQLLLIHKDELLKLFKENLTIMENFLDIISDRAQFLSRRIKLMSLSSIKGKISYYLLDLVKKNGQNELTLPHSQKELAEIFGVSRPSVGRAFREMHDSGCVNAKGKNVRILDNTRLSALLSGKD